MKVAFVFYVPLQSKLSSIFITLYLQKIKSKEIKPYLNWRQRFLNSKKNNKYKSSNNIRSNVKQRNTHIDSFSPYKKVCLFVKCSLLAGYRFLLRLLLIIIYFSCTFAFVAAYSTQHAIVWQKHTMQWWTHSNGWFWIEKKNAERRAQ